MKNMQPYSMAIHVNYSFLSGMVTVLHSYMVPIIQNAVRRLINVMYFMHINT